MTLALEFRLCEGVSGQLLSFRLSPKSVVELLSLLIRMLQEVAKEVQQACSMQLCSMQQSTPGKQILHLRDRSRHVKFQNVMGGEMADETGLREFFQISGDRII